METGGRGTGKTEEGGRVGRPRIGSMEGEGKAEKNSLLFRGCTALDGWIGSGISLLADGEREREREKEDRKVFLMKYS